MARFARSFYRLFRLAIILTPLLIGYRGYTYLRECFRTLAAPGTGVDFTYQAREGSVLHITADSYSYLWGPGLLHVRNPRLRDEGGEMLASADSASVSGLKLPSSGPINADVRNLRAKLVRLATGKFELEQYLPEHTPESEDRPFHVRIDDVDLNYVDLSGKDRFSQRATSDQMIVEGLGDQWIASGPLNLPTVGTAEAAVQRYRNSGLVIALNARRLNLGRVLNHFRTTPEGRDLDVLKQFHADTLVAEGPVRLYVPEKQPFQVATSLTATATNVLYGNRDRFNSAAFSGLVVGTGVSGTLKLNRGASEATFVGSADWSKGARFAGDIRARVANRSDIPPSLQGQLPADFGISGATGRGWLSFDDRAGFRYDGNLTASRLAVSGQSFDVVNGLVRAGNGLVRLEAVNGVWKGAPLQGSLAYYPEGRRIAGQVYAEKVNLAQVGRVANVQGMTGLANANALLSGSVSEPVAALRAEGNITFRSPGARRPISGQFEGAGTYANSALALSSLTVDTPTGTVAATGRANPRGALALNVAARGISLNAFAPDVSGSASFSGLLTGTASNPSLAGRAQVVGLKAGEQTVPLLVADIRANRDRISARSLRAVRGAAEASGNLDYGVRNGAIQGSFNALNLPISELSDQLTGIIDIRNAKVSGTLANPIVDANLETHGLVIADRPIGRGRASIAVRGNTFSIPQLQAQVAKGTVVASATGNIKTRQARIEVTANNLSLADLAPERTPTASLEGTVSGTAVLGTVGAEVRYARGSGTLADAMINRTLIGSGTWNASATPQAFGGSMQIGTLERYFELSNLAVNRTSKELVGDLTAYHIPLREIYNAVERYLPEAGSDVERRIRRIEGVADARAAVSGPLSAPNVNLSVLELTGLTLEGRDLGRFTAQVDKVGPVWTFTQLNWESVAGTLRSSGIVNEDEAIRFEGDFTNVDLGLLSILNDNLTRIRGRAGLAFSIDGPTSSPTVTASLDASRTTVITGEGEQSQLEFGMVIPVITISESSLLPSGQLQGGIQASGKLFYRGFEGNLTAQVPLQFPFTLPEGQPLAVALDLPERDLQTLNEYFPSIDPARTKGTVSGHVALNGVVGAATMDGRVTANASTFALKKVQTTLSGAKAEARVDRNAVRIAASGTSSEGGAVSANAEAPIGDVGERIRELSSRGLDAMLDRTLSGDLSLNDFGIRYDQGDEGRLIGKANAKLALSGPVRSPLVEGNASLSGVNTVLPTFEVTESTMTAYAVDPRFNVKLSLVDTSTVRSSVARLRIIGDGSLTGSLSSPNINSDLTVMGGSVNLATTSVRIQSGGTVRLRYSTGPAGDALASLNVDLTGTTSLTALEYGDIPQRYEVTLNIRGNLLEEGQTFITAESDPPGLSQQKILAMLGQSDLIAALASSVQNLEASRQLRNAVAGYAVPALLQPLTTAFAKGLGLEYFNVEYDPFNQVSFAFAKSVGKNLTLQGRRQLSPPLPGFRTQYDYRLVYRLPFGGRELKRTALSFGIDQDRPWKVSMEYGFRF